LSTKPEHETKTAQSLFSRITWFILIWLGSVAALTVVAYGIRLMIK